MVRGRPATLGSVCKRPRSRWGEGVATPSAQDVSARSAEALRQIRIGFEGKGMTKTTTEDDDVESSLLDDARHHIFQSVAARLNYYALDRPDVQYAVKELMRRMTNATEDDFVALKRVVRYLLTVPRLVSEYRWDALGRDVVVYADANWAGCLRTRKSTLGGSVTWSNSTMKTWSKTMLVLALSSGESELAAVVKAAGEGLGFVSSLADFGFEAKLVLRSDATAAIRICKREGLGRVRHLATGDLWIQQLLKHRRAHIEKWPGVMNPADLMTKSLRRDKILQLLDSLSMKMMPGRSPLAPVRSQTVARETAIPFEESADSDDDANPLRNFEANVSQRVPVRPNGREGERNNGHISGTCEHL